MLRKFSLWMAGLTLVCVATPGGTFGKVVAIGGAASDVALDESRGVLYIANFTANRIEQMSLSGNTIQTSINVAAQPSSIALSPDGRYLLVAHYGNFASPSSPSNGLTVIDLNSNAKQTFVLGNPPLGVGFGIDGRALVVTTQEFILFDPVIGTTQVLDTVTGVAAKTLPVAPASFPPNITAASINVSADGLWLYGVGGSTSTFTFRYDVANRAILPGGVVLGEGGLLGPRVVSLNRDGSKAMVGWLEIDLRTGTFLNQFGQRTNALNVGSAIFDDARGLIYAQVPQTANEAPTLRVLDAASFAIREQLQLPENLGGKSVLTSDAAVLYAVSDSGVLVMPVGSLGQQKRIVASQEDLVFRGNFCDRRVASQQLTVSDPGGNATRFSISTDIPGITISPASGTTPAIVRVSVDPNAFQNQKGTAAAMLQITSADAINVIPPVRVLINNHEPDQRGTFVNIPGALTDILADPARDRYFVVRQDKNQILVMDAANNTQIAALPTLNTPTTMSFTYDRRYLLAGHENSQTVAVWDLETLQPLTPIQLPSGHVARSIAASAKALLAFGTDVQGKGRVMRLDFDARSGIELPSLGIFQNDLNPSGVLTASSNGSSVLFAAPDGTVMLYSAIADSFTVSRKDFTSLGGAYGASDYGQFVVGSNLLNASLVPMGKLETGTGTPSGFSFIDQSAFRTTAPDASSPGVIQRVDLASIAGIRATRMTEAPLLGTKTTPFIRTLAPLYSRTAMLNLTTSGVTVLPWSYDQAVAIPQISRVVNAGDQSPALAPGGLITLYGNQLSPVNLATKEMPLPTALGESCLTINGMPVPVLFVSPGQINAQLPYAAAGNVTMVLRTPGGISDNFNLTLQSAAPGIFRSGTAGPDINIPTVVRDSNNTLVTDSNPVHRGDTLIIYLTGMGLTTPAVTAGLPAPSQPLASALIPPRVSIGGVDLPVAYAGLTPGEVGVYQINVNVPRTVPTGLSQALSINQSGNSTDIQVRVVD
jgi:uncharacterized protein (TIGR03437 family)